MALAFGDADAGVPVVSVDNVAGAALAADHLAGLGHRRFAVLTMELADGPGGRVGPAEVAAALYATSRERVDGYFAALARHGVDTAPIPLFETNADPATIETALAALFAAPEPPTALLCQSDRIAMRALDWLRRAASPSPPTSPSSASTASPKRRRRSRR